MVTNREILEYKPGRADESTKGKPADEYEEVTETNSRIYKDEFNDPDYEEGVNIEEILEFIPRFVHMVLSASSEIMTRHCPEGISESINSEV